VIPKWPKENYVSFSLKQLSITEEWVSIVHFKDPNYDQANGRRPALYIFDGRLFLWHGIDGNLRVKVIENIPMAINTFIDIYYEQRYVEALGNYVVSLFVNNALVVERENSNASEVENVKVYACDGWQSAGDTIIKDLKFGSL